MKPRQTLKYAVRRLDRTELVKVYTYAHDVQTGRGWRRVGATHLKLR